MEERKEYFLKFTIATDKHEKINYYTRAMLMNEEVVPKQIAFAKKFSDEYDFLPYPLYNLLFYLYFPLHIVHEFLQEKQRR